MAPFQRVQIGNRWWPSGGIEFREGAIGSAHRHESYPAAGMSNISSGAFALYNAPNLVCELHCDYALAGADVLMTNTYGPHRAARVEIDGLLLARIRNRKDKAKLAVRLAREGAALRDRTPAPLRSASRSEPA